MSDRNVTAINESFKEFITRVGPGMGTAEAIHWREAVPADAGFLFHSWLKSYRTAPTVEAVARETYFRAQHARIASLLQRSLVLVAGDAEAPEHILGYVVYEPHAVHWAYVKTTFRRFGIASELLRRAGVLRVPHTHDTKLGRLLAVKLESPFNPYLLEHRP